MAIKEAYDGFFRYLRTEELLWCDSIFAKWNILRKAEKWLWLAWFFWEKNDGIML